MPPTTCTPSYRTTITNIATTPHPPPPPLAASFPPDPPPTPLSPYRLPHPQFTSPPRSLSRFLTLEPLPRRGLRLPRGLRLLPGLESISHLFLASCDIRFRRKRHGGWGLEFRLQVLGLAHDLGWGLGPSSKIKMTTTNNSNQQKTTHSAATTITSSQNNTTTTTNSSSEKEAAKKNTTAPSSCVHLR